ncbi:MAG: hypothetical protein R3C24_01845 [Cyanobacteriota/Melainabacteria group bacterium]
MAGRDFVGNLTEVSPTRSQIDHAGKLYEYGHEIAKESFIKAEPSEVYRWHMAPGAFLRLKPPWENVELVNSEKELFEGARALNKDISSLQYADNIYRLVGRAH